MKYLLLSLVLMAGCADRITYFVYGIEKPDTLLVLEDCKPIKVKVPENFCTWKSLWKTYTLPRYNFEKVPITEPSRVK